MRQWLIVLIVFAFSACACRPPRPDTAPLPAAAPHCPFNELTLRGIGTNVTVNASSGVQFKITCSNGKLRAVGAYDGITLFGRFDAPGRVLPYCHGVGSLCLQFEGALQLGGDRSNFPEGTSAPYVMSLALTDLTGRGTYQIGLLPSFDFPQAGILELFPIQRN